MTLDLKALREIAETSLTGEFGGHFVMRCAGEDLIALLDRLERAEKALEYAAKRHEEKAARHAIGATWMGPQRQRYEGPRPHGVEANPMNGPAIAFDHEIAEAAAIRALSHKEPTP